MVILKYGSRPIESWVLGEEIDFNGFGEVQVRMMFDFCSELVRKDEARACACKNLERLIGIIDQRLFEECSSMFFEGFLWRDAWESWDWVAWNRLFGGREEEVT